MRWFWLAGLLYIGTSTGFMYLRRSIRPFTISIDRDNCTQYHPSVLEWTRDNMKQYFKNKNTKDDNIQPVSRIAKYLPVWKYVENIDDLFVRLCIFYKYDWDMKIIRSNREISNLLETSEYAVKITLDQMEPVMRRLLYKIEPDRDLSPSSNNTD